MFQDVVAAIDGSPASFRAAALGAQLAAAEDGCVELVAVTRPRTGLLRIHPADPEDERSRRAADLRSAAVVIGDPSRIADAEVLEGPIADAILGRCDERSGRRLIAVGSGKHRLRLGSVSTAILRNSRCPVLVVREGASRGPRLQRIQVGFDGTPGAWAAVAVAADLSAHAGSEVHVVWVLRPSFPMPARGLPLSTDEIQELAGEPERRELAEAARQIREAGGKVARTVFELGRAEDRLLALADDADVDLLVVGARGEDAPATRRVLGGVSDHIVARSPRPVLVVK